MGQVAVQALVKRVHLLVDMVQRDWKSVGSRNAMPITDAQLMHALQRSGSFLRVSVEKN